RRLSGLLARHAAFFGQRTQLCTDTIVGFLAGLLLVAVCSDLVHQNVFGFEKEVNHVLAEHHFATTNVVEQVFQQVRRIGQHTEAAEGARATLDGVGGTENTVELVNVRIIDIQAQEQLLHVVEQLIGFVKKRIEKL